jgi:chromosome segregation ATPase
MQEAALHQQAAAEVVEANLRTQSQQLKQALAQAEDSERDASSTLSSINAKLTTSQEKLASLRRELNTSKADLDAAKRR